MCSVKQSENLRPAMVTLRRYLGGAFQPPQILAIKSDAVGTGRYSLLYGDRPVKPTVPTWSAAEHRSVVGSSIRTSTEPWFQLASPPRPFGRIEGDIAACACPETLSYVGTRPEFTGGPEAVMKAAGKLLEPDVDYGMIGMEMHETIKMFTSPLAYLAKEIPRMCKRGRPPKISSPRKALEYASNMWLQYRYGISPTISDANAIAAHYAEITKPRKVLYKKGAGVSGLNNQSRVSGKENFAGGVLTSSYEVKEVDYYVSHLYYNIVDPAAYDKARTGLSIYNLPNLAWELVPFSFVLDWVIDVGAWLRAITPKPFYQKLGQTVSYVRRREMSYNTYMFTIYADGRWAVPCISSYQTVSKRYVRNVNPPLPTLPPVNWNIMKLVRAIDTASLTMRPLLKLTTNLLKGK